MHPLFKVFMPSSLNEGVGEILTSGTLNYGEYTKNFERRVRSFIGNPNFLSLSGNSVHFALKTIGIAPGDEVIASPMSCLVGTQPVVYSGAKVVWADIDPLTGTLDPVDVERKITSNTKAIIHYHWAGYPGYISEINRIGKQYGIVVIEDASAAFAAEYNGNKIGNTGSDIVCFSFNPVRLPNAIDGSGVVINDNDLFSKACLMRDLGVDRNTFRDEIGEISEKSDVLIPGDSLSMGNISGYVGLNQMDYLSGNLQRQRENAMVIRQKLAERSNVEPLPMRSGVVPSYWVFTLLANDRDNMLNDLRSKGFYASKVHVRNDIYSVFGKKDSSLKGVYEFSSKQLSIPCGWWMKESDYEL